MSFRVIRPAFLISGKHYHNVCISMSEKTEKAITKALEQMTLNSMSEALSKELDSAMGKELNQDQEYTSKESPANLVHTNDCPSCTGSREYVCMPSKVKGQWANTCIRRKIKAVMATLNAEGAEVSSKPRRNKSDRRRDRNPMYANLRKGK